MPRGVRKSSLEKLQNELQDTKKSIVQYKDSIKTLEEKKAQIEEGIKLERLKELSSLIDNSGMSLEDAKDLITRNKKS